MCQLRHKFPPENKASQIFNVVAAGVRRQVNDYDAFAIFTVRFENDDEEEECDGDGYDLQQQKECAKGRD